MTGSRITVLSATLLVLILTYYGVYKLPASLFANPILSPINSMLSPTISWFKGAGINFKGVPLILGVITAIMLTLLISHEVNKKVTALAAEIKEKL